MKNPFRHHTQTTTMQPPRVPDTPAELLDEAMPPAMPDPHSVRVPEHPGELVDDMHGHVWRHMQQDVDPDCARDPGSDLKASWELEGAAAEEAQDPAGESPKDV